MKGRHRPPLLRGEGLLDGSGPRGLVARLQSFGISLVIHLALPLLPLVVEWRETGAVGNKSLAVASGMWVLGVAVSSESLFVLVAGVFAGLVLTASVGEPTPHVSPLRSPELSRYVMAVFAVVGVVERAIKHLYHGAPCSPPERE